MDNKNAREDLRERIMRVVTVLADISTDLEKPENAHVRKSCAFAPSQFGILSDAYRYLNEGIAGYRDPEEALLIACGDLRAMMALPYLGQSRDAACVVHGELIEDIRAAYRVANLNPNRQEGCAYARQSCALFAPRVLALLFPNPSQ